MRDFLENLSAVHKKTPGMESHTVHILYIVKLYMLLYIIKL